MYYNWYNLDIQLSQVNVLRESQVHAGVDYFHEHVIAML